MAMSFRAQFLTEIHVFLSTHNMGPTAFGREALKDPNFVFDLEAGRSPRLDTIERAQEFMRDFTPANTEAAA